MFVIRVHVIQSNTHQANSLLFTQYFSFFDEQNRIFFSLKSYRPINGSIFPPIILLRFLVYIVQAVILTYKFTLCFQFCLVFESIENICCLFT